MAVARDPDTIERTGAQSIGRAFALMRLVASGRESGVGLSDIATLAGLPRPTAHRILAALVREGMVEQKPRTRRYVLGEEVQFLALSRTVRPGLVRDADPLLARAAAEIGDTLFLTLRSGHDTICIGRRLGSYPIQVLVLDAGDRRPLGISSAGIAILACLPEREAAAILRENEVRLRARGSSVRQALEEVARARALGHVLRAPGLVPGTRAVSVPIRRGSGEALAALTVAAVSRRLAPARIEALLDALHRHAAAFTPILARGVAETPWSGDDPSGSPNP